MIETILKEHAGELMGAISQNSELDAGQAERLLPPALGGITDALTSGQLDVAGLLGGGGGGVSALLGQLDIGDIAAQAGLEEGPARGGLTALIPVVLQLLGQESGGAEGLLSLLGGGQGGGGKLGSVLGAAGKLFGK